MATADQFIAENKKGAAILSREFRTVVEKLDANVRNNGLTHTARQLANSELATAFTDTLELAKSALFADYDQERARAHSSLLPKVTSSNVAEWNYWDEFAESYFVGLSGAALIRELKIKLEAAEATPTAKAALIAAARPQVSVEGIVTQEFRDVIRPHLTGEERQREEDARVFDGLWIRVSNFGWIARGVTDDVRQLVRQAPSHVTELRGGLTLTHNFGNTNEAPLVLDYEIFNKWGQNLEEAVKRIRAGRNPNASFSTWAPNPSDYQGAEGMHKVFD